jgi:hypothetical protein
MAEAHRGQPAPRAHTIIIKIMNHSNWSLLPPRAHMCHIAITLVVYIMHQCSRRPCLFFILYNERERESVFIFYSLTYSDALSARCQGTRTQGRPFLSRTECSQSKIWGKTSCYIISWYALEIWIRLHHKKRGP